MEVERLTKKLKWYAENQELLDKDVICLKQKEEEITRLKMRIEQLQSEVRPSDRRIFTVKHHPMFQSKLKT